MAVAYDAVATDTVIAGESFTTAEFTIDTGSIGDRAAVAALALGNAYVAASGLPFETVRDIDEVEALLDTQYDAVLNNGGAQEAKDAVTDMRIRVLEAFDAARITAGKIIAIHTLPTTARLLGYAYYGNDVNFDILISLNNLSDISFVEGDVEVITG